MFDLRRVVTLLAVALGACATIGQSRDERFPAIDRMTAVRCERARACGAAYDHCFERLRPATARDLGLSRCADAVRDDRLDRCLGAIRERPCGPPLDDMTQVYDCLVGRICTTGPAEGTM